jgi:hypothetical protein
MTSSDRPILLIADPEPFSRSLAEAMLGLQFTVVHTRAIQETVDRALRDRPGVVLSELYLEDGNFEELRSRLHAQPSMRGVPVVLLTNLSRLVGERYPDLGPHRVVDKRNIVATLPPVLQRSQARFRPLDQAATISILIEPERETIVQVYGAGRHIERYGIAPFRQYQACAEQLAAAEPRQFGGALEYCGTELFALLEQGCRLDTTRREVMERAGDSPLRIQFIGGPESLQIPFETLMNPAERKPLAIQHRFTRAILRPPGVYPCGRSDFLARRVRTGGPYAALLIGLAEDPEADAYRIGEELQRVKDIILALRRGTRVDCVPLLPRQATPERIAREVSSRDWDVIHIAGHCPPPRGDVHSDGIPFRAEDSDAVDRLTSARLKTIVAARPPAFLLMHCCHGTEVYADALVRAGVPAFLTVRGSHASADFVLFARELYEGLTEYGDLEMAVQLARSRVYETLHTSNLWATASLMVQSL